MGYERTEIGFAKAFKDLKSMITRHKKPYWIFASNDQYHVSVIKPRLVEIAENTRANLYNIDFESGSDEPFIEEYIDGERPFSS